MEQYIDILFFAILAGVLFFKLRKTLGEYNEEDKPDVNETEKKNQTVSKNEARIKPETGTKVTVLPTAQLRSLTASRSVADAVKQIMLRHESFDPGHFLQGASRAFDMIVNAYTSGNKTLLKKLLTEDLYKTYEADIDQRQKEGKVLEILVHAIKKAMISDVEVRENLTRIAVTFHVSETVFTRDKNGDIIEGDPSEKEDVTDIWTFEQKTSTQDPTWYLAQTDEDTNT